MSYLSVDHTATAAASLASRSSTVKGLVEVALDACTIEGIGEALWRRVGTLGKFHRGAAGLAEGEIRMAGVGDDRLLPDSLQALIPYLAVVAI